MMLIKMMNMLMMICINWLATNVQLIKDGQMAPVRPDLAPSVN